MQDAEQWVVSHQSCSNTVSNKYSEQSSFASQHLQMVTACVALPKFKGLF